MKTQTLTGIVIDRNTFPTWTYAVVIDGVILPVRFSHRDEAVELLGGMKARAGAPKVAEAAE